MVGDQPLYVTDDLPGMVLTGTGVGFMLPTLTGAGASELPPARFATGIAVITMGRQVGAAIGVAAAGATATTAGDFHAAWAVAALAGVATGLLLAALGPHPRPVEALTPALA